MSLTLLHRRRGIGNPKLDSLCEYFVVEEWRGYLPGSLATSRGGLHQLEGSGSQVFKSTTSDRNVNVPHSKAFRKPAEVVQFTEASVLPQVVWSEQRHRAFSSCRGSTQESGIKELSFSSHILETGETEKMKTGRSEILQLGKLNRYCLEIIHDPGILRGNGEKCLNSCGSCK